MRSVDGAEPDGRDGPEQSSTPSEQSARDAFDTAAGSGPLAGALARFWTEFAVATALEYAHGRRCLTVIHGQAETVADEAALHDLSRDLEQLAVQLGGHPGQLVRVTGTNDMRTWWWDSSDTLDAQRVVDAALNMARGYDRGWWRCQQEPV